MLLAAVALVAAVVQASTGLGFALILSPAVFALLEPESAVVAITVLGLALNGLVLFAERRRPAVAWREVGRSSSPRCPAPSAACSSCARCRSPCCRSRSARRSSAPPSCARGRAATRRSPRRRSARAGRARIRHRRPEHVGGRQRPADGAVVRPPRARPAEIRDSLSAAFLALGVIAAVVLAPVLATADVVESTGPRSSWRSCSSSPATPSAARLRADRRPPLRAAAAGDRGRGGRREHRRRRRHCFHLIEQPTGSVSARDGSSPARTASSASRSHAAFCDGSWWSASGAPR